MIPEINTETENMLAELKGIDAAARQRIVAWGKLVKELPRVVNASNAIEDPYLLEYYNFLVYGEIYLTNELGKGDSDFHIIFYPSNRAALVPIKDKIGYKPSLNEGTWQEVYEEAVKMLNTLIPVPEPPSR